MINVYLLGHGFLWENGQKLEKIRPVFPIRTYVEDDTLLDADAVGGLIDTGKFPLSSKTDHYVERTTYPSATITQHLLCSALRTRLDYENTDKYMDMDPEFQKENLFSFKGGFGTLTRLDKQTYVYETEPGQLTRLSDIQTQVKLHFEIQVHERVDPLDVMLHWAACRSRVTAWTHESLLSQTQSALIKPQGLAGEPLPSGGDTILLLDGKKIPESNIVAAIKEAMAAELLDCSISDAKPPFLITIVARTAKGRDSITSQYAFFQTLRGRTEDVAAEYMSYPKPKVVFAEDGDIDMGAHCLKKGAVSAIVARTKVP